VQAIADRASVLVTEMVTLGEEVTVLTVVVRTVMTVLVVVDCLSVVVTTAKVVLPLLTVTTGGVEVEVEVATVVEVMVVATSVDTAVEVMKREVSVSVMVVVAESGARLCNLVFACLCSLLDLRSAILAARSRGTARSKRPRRIF